MTESKKSPNNDWAIITGGTSGIGLAYATELAKKKKPIILVARNESKLAEVAESLSREYGVASKFISADLSNYQGVNKVIDETSELSVDLLINNAGKEESGQYLMLNTQEMLSSIALNCAAPMRLTHHFANKMVGIGGGDILYLSSIVAFQGVPLIANYAATKSFLLTFAEGIAEELAPQGVKVSIATPGFTNTNLYDLSNLPFKPLEAEFVAQYTLKRLGTKRVIIPGFINKILYFTGKYLQPRRMNTFAFAKVFQRVLKEKLTVNKTMEQNS